MMNIRIVDIETTGLDPESDAIIEVGWCDLRPDAIDLAGAPCHWRTVVSDGHDGFLADPGRDIPPQSSAVHHIVRADVVDRPTPAEIVQLMYASAGPGAIFCAHNAKFERAFLAPVLPGAPRWICTYKCALRLWPDAPSHGNAALRYWRGLDGVDRSLMTPTHRAGPDAYITATLLAEMLDGPDCPSLDTLIEWSNQPALQVTCHIGAWRGHKWTDVDDGFLRWVAARDFDEDILYTVRHEIDRRAAVEQENAE